MYRTFGGYAASIFGVKRKPSKLLKKLAERLAHSSILKMDAGRFTDPFVNVRNIPEDSPR
jgi:hypothetical protein